MVRFLHTADLQLGMRATDVPGVAATLREQRFTALERTMALAREEAVDFVVVAGDLFEHNQISAETSYRAARLLAAAAPIPVYLLPGNHDPLSADSVYHRPAFMERRPDNVVVLTEAQPVALMDGSCALCPFPVREQRSSFDPTAQVSDPPAVPGVKVGVAHGSLAIEGLHSSDDHPIRADCAERLGLDYLALGHWHSHFRHGRRAVYAGTPEATSFGERDAGSVSLVSIDGPGAAPAVEARPVGELTWLQWEVDLPDQPLSAMQRQVEGLASPDRTLLRVVLRGTADADTILALDDLEAWLRAQGLLYVDLRREVVATQALLSRLARLTEEDPVLASVVADLQRLATLDGSGEAGTGAMATARPVEDLLALWDAARSGTEVSRPAAATHAITELARLAQEVV